MRSYLILHNYLADCKQHMRFFWLVLLVLSLFTLGVEVSGCASFYDAVPDLPPPKYTKPSVIDQDFNISGRFSIKQPSNSSYGNFIWVKESNTEELSFNTPLGQTVAKITVESGGLATLTADNKSYTGDDLDDLMEDRLGYVLPMAYLHYWMQGVSVPSAPVVQELNDGFVQLGWKVEYLQWVDANHPQIVQCSRGDLVVKFLIEW